MSPKLLKIEDLAALWGVSSRAVREWLSDTRPAQTGTGRRGSPNLYTVPQVAALRYGVGGTGVTDQRLDLEQERARQAHETANKLALENALTRGEVAPIDHFETEIEQYTRQLAALLDGIGPNLRRLLPHLSDADHHRIEQHIADERNRFSAGLAGDQGTDADGDTEGSGTAVRAAEAAAQ